jgi:transcriptional regulator with XRE-family HTH domain
MRDDAVSLTIRKLRQALGESQQQFAHRLNMAIRTIARYETVRPPRGLALVQLQRTAEAHGLDEYAAVFRRAAAAAVGVEPDLTSEQFRDALLRSLEDPEVRNALKHAMEPGP